MEPTEKKLKQHKVEVSLFRHAGDIEKVSRELNVPYKYVRRVATKIKEKFSRDVDYYVATGIMQELRLAREHRRSLYLEELERLRNRLITHVSSCCRRPMAEQPLAEKVLYTCTKCHRICEPLEIDNVELLRIRLSIVNKMKEEDEMLCGCAEKLGFTGKITLPQTVVKQDFIMIGETEGEKKIIDDLDKLDAMGREKLRRSLEKQISEKCAEFEDEKSSTKKKNKIKRSSKLS